MEKKKMSLPVQIVLALILGIAVGLIFYFIGKPEITTNYFKPFGTIFVNLLFLPYLQNPPKHPQ